MKNLGYIIIVPDLKKNTPYSPEYLVLTLDGNETFENQIEKIISVAQGEYVILKESGSIPLQIKTLVLLNKISKEVILETKSSLKIVLFRNTQDEVIRDSSVNTTYIDQHFNLKPQDHKQTLFLDKVWSNCNSTLEADKLTESFIEIKKLVRSPTSVVLVGDMSAALFLLVVVKILPTTKTIYYQKDNFSLVERVY